MLNFVHSKLTDIDNSTTLLTNSIVGNVNYTPIYANFASGSTTNLTGNYSGGATDFSYTAINDNTIIEQIKIVMSDNGAFRIRGFARITGAGTPLTNGINFFIDKTSKENFITNIKRTDDLFTLSDSTPFYSSNLNNHVFHGIIKCRVLLNTGQSIGVTLNDNFTGLVSHRYSVSGYYY